jgi:ketosteroid isomerase-like protein
MKWTVLQLLAALALAGMTPASAQQTEWNPSDSLEKRGFEDPKNVIQWQRNRAVQRAFQAALFARDFGKLAQYVDLEFELIEPAGLPIGGTYRGIEGFMRFWEAVPKYMKIHSNEFKHTYITDDPNRVVQEFVVKGTVIATGEEFESPVFDRFVFRNGKILSISPFYFNLPNVKPH